MQTSVEFFEDTPSEKYQKNAHRGGLLASDGAHRISRAVSQPQAAGMCKLLHTPNTFKVTK
jgi:hypothetical protein